MSRKKRTPPQINASSMADIAFLLLIFFLVTTTIKVDKGILHRLPPWLEEEEPPMDFHDRNVLEVMANARDQLQVEKKLRNLSELRDLTTEFLLNNGANPTLSDSPDKAVISLKNDRGTSYELYLGVQNELKAAYRVIRDKETKELTNGKYVYGDLNTCADPLNKQTKAAEKQRCKDWKAQVKEKYPMKISEAEPESIGS